MKVSALEDEDEIKSIKLRRNSLILENSSSLKEWSFRVARPVVVRLLDDNYTLNSGVQTTTSHLEQEEGVEEGAAIYQRKGQLSIRGTKGSFWLSEFLEGLEATMDYIAQKD